MKADSENLSAQESLDLITSMILEAKGNAQRNNFFFLFWGWIVVLADLGMYALWKMNYKHFYIVWLITIPAWIFTAWKVTRMRKERHATTHFDRISGFLWMSFGITIFVVVAFGYKINFQINPVILAMSAMPTLVSGIILRFKPLVAGGILFWVFSIICFLVDREFQPLVGAVAIVCGYLIPGYLLRAKKDQ